MAKDTLSRFDAADYLKSDEAVAAYLDAVMDDSPGDAGALAKALGTVARARNMSQLARDTGLSREGLLRALSASGNPSLATLLKVAQALGLKLRFAPG